MLAIHEWNKWGIINGKITLDDDFATRQINGTMMKGKILTVYGKIEFYPFAVSRW